MGIQGVRRASARGAAAVEFALVVPFLLLLVFAIISYGMMLSLRQSLSQAADEGARAAAVGVVDANRTTDAQTAINDAMSANGVKCTAGQLMKGSTQVGKCEVGSKTDCADPNPDGNQCVTVTLTYWYDDHPVVPTIGIGFAMPDTLTYSATARVS